MRESPRRFRKRVKATHKVVYRKHIHESRAGVKYTHYVPHVVRA